MINNELLINSFFEFTKKREIIISVEKFIKREKYLLVDFSTSLDFLFFTNIFNKKYDEIRRPTMIEFINYDQDFLQEGYYYSISSETLLLLIERITIVENSLVIGYRIDLQGLKSKLISNNIPLALIRNTLNRVTPSSSDPHDLKFNLGKVNKVIVRNIGQGNWNEILYNDKFKLIFDSGVLYSTKSNIVSNLKGDRDNLYQKDKPSFILSHWDVDHYHFLLAFEDETIKSFKKFIFRNIIPNLTSLKVISRFLSLNPSSLVPIDTVPVFNTKDNKLFESYLTNNKKFIFFNSRESSSRNYSGLGLAIKEKLTSVIFSGDYKYSQVSDYILPILNYKSNQYFIVPHHGGEAGKFVYNDTTNVFKDAIISTGKNPYGHPLKKYINKLKQKGFRVIRTDRIKFDKIIKLK